MTWIIGLLSLVAFAVLLAIIGLMIDVADREVFHRPDPTTDCPVVVIEETDDVCLG